MGYGLSMIVASVQHGRCHGLGWTAPDQVFSAAMNMCTHFGARGGTPYLCMFAIWPHPRSLRPPYGRTVSALTPMRRAAIWRRRIPRSVP
jgi:hypothetical protein